jgi:amino acid adenylation domain-containing protein
MRPTAARTQAAGETLVAAIRWRIERHRDKVAYRFLAEGEEESLAVTFGELDARARAVAAFLQAEGAAGERVLLVYPPGIDFIVAFLGCLYAGAIAVPAYPPRSHRPDARLAAIVADARPRFAFSVAAIAERAAALAAQLPALAGLLWVATEELAAGAAADLWRPPSLTAASPAFLQYTSGSTAAPKGVVVTQGSLLHNERMIQQAFGQSEESVVVGWLPLFHDMGLIGNVLQPLYAGASCVLMSPVAFLQQPLRWLRAINRYRATTSGGPNFAYELCLRKVGPADREGLDLSRWTVAYNGAEPVRAGTLDRFAAEFAACGFRREAFYPCYGLAEATLFVTGGLLGVPPAITAFDAAALARNEAVLAGGLQSAAGAGSGAGDHAASGGPGAAAEAAASGAYTARAGAGEGAGGAAEEDAASGTATASEIRELVACGRGWLDQTVAIVDPETSTPLPDGRIGEIWVAGPSVAAGYWNRAEATAETFGARLATPGQEAAETGPFLRTGDLGFLHGGELYVTGRIKDLIIVRGRNLYPQDLELTAERSHPALRAGCGAAFAVEVDGEERVVVVCEVERGQRKKTADVIAELRRAIAQEHEVPLHAVALLKPGALPKTSSGKVRRQAARAAFLEGRLDLVDSWREGAAEASLAGEGESRPPRTPTEARLLDLWREVFGAVAGVDDDFFALGGDSLKATQLAARVQQAFGVEAAIDRLLATPTVAAQATALDEVLGSAVPALPPLAASGPSDAPSPLSFAQRRLWFLHQLEPDNPVHNIAAVLAAHGALEVEALRAALDEIVRRHGALRTVYGRRPPKGAEGIGESALGDEPVQWVVAAAPFALPLADLTALPEGVAGVESERLTRDLARLPFDLESGLLIRALLIRLRCSEKDQLGGFPWERLRQPTPHTSGWRELVLPGVRPGSAGVWPATNQKKLVRAGETPALPGKAADRYSSEQRRSRMGSSDDHALVLSWHHIAADGWSLGVFARELVALYPAALAGEAGRPSPLSEPGLQYADYAAWQRGWMRGEALSSRLAYWLRQLGGERGALPIVELPADRARPPVLSHRGAHRETVIASRVAAPVESLARERGATPFLALLAAFASLVHRYTHQEDLALGAPISGRHHAGLDDLMGVFLNNLVLRLDATGEPSYRTLLTRVRDTALAAYAHQDLPFELLVDALKPERDLSRTPLFQILFVGQSAPLARLDLPGLTIEPREVDLGTARFDLALSVAPIAEGWLGTWKYSTDLFDPATIARLGEHLENLLVAAAAAPDLPIARLSLLAEAERHQTLQAWSDTAFADSTWRDQTLHGLIAAQAARTPEAIAVSFEDEELTYRELDARAGALSRRLVDLGVQPADLVGVAAERSLEMVVALYGILKAGAAYVPLDLAYPSDRLEYMLADSGVRALVTQERLLSYLPPHQAQVLLLDTPNGLNGPAGGLEEKDQVGRSAAAAASGGREAQADGPRSGKAARMASLPGKAGQDAAAQTASSQSEQLFEGPAQSRHLPMGPAYAIYTSGSTGRPKGAVVPHRGIVNRLLWMQEAYGLTAHDRVLQKTPYSFDVSVWEFFWPLLAGARLVMAPPGAHLDAAWLARILAERGITTLHFVPSMLQLFLEVKDLETSAASVRQVMASGEALPFELKERFYRRFDPARTALHNLYGPTEASVDVSFHPCRPADLAVPIGRPIRNTALYVLDRELRPVPAGVPGELLIGGVSLAHGYLGRPALTAERFVPAPWGAEPGGRLYRTGDLARFAASGAIEYLGRLDFQVKVRGVRIELGEIEAALLRHAGVREAAVVVRKGAQGEARLAAYWVGNLQAPGSAPRQAPGSAPRQAPGSAPRPAPGPAVDPAASPQDGDTAPGIAELRALLRETLPEAMVPAYFVRLAALPLTPSGKVDRRALPAPAAEAEPRGPAYVAPRSPLEARLAGLWREVLKVERVGIHDSFFELGGDSIQGAMLINRLQDELGEIVYVMALFDAPTVAQLAAYLEASYGDAVARLEGREAAGREGETAPATAPVEPAEPPEPIDAALSRLVAAVAGRLGRSPGEAPAVVAGVAAAAGVARNPRAVFVLSPFRSGTTLFRVMLAGHPGLFAPPELELLPFATLAERASAYTGRNLFAREGLLRAVMELRGCDAEGARAIVAGYEAEGLSTPRFYALLQEWSGGRLLIDKTPSYVLDLPSLAHAEEWFEEPLYIHLTRHPRATIDSYLEAKMDRVYDFPFPPPEQAELVWLLAHQNVLRFLAGVPAHRVLRLRFEEMVREPRGAMAEVSRFLGVPFAEAMLEPYSGRRMTDGLNSASRMMGDPKFHRHQGIDAAVAERWRGTAGRALRAETVELARRLGYEVAPAMAMPAADEPPSLGGTGSVSTQWRRGRSRTEPERLKAEGRALGPRPQSDPTPQKPSLYPLIRQPEGARPLSFAQERLWFLGQLDPGNPAYNMPAVVRIEGRLDAAALAAAFDEVRRRHEVLRTAFPAERGLPRQAVAAEHRRPLPGVDLAALPAAAREAEAERIAREEGRRPFDLERGPLLRAALLRLGAEEQRLLVTMHHIVSDGWTIGILIRELAAIYGAAVEGRPSPLPALAVQYADYARWQRRRLDGAAMAAHLDFWRRRLSGRLPALEMPTDRPRPATQTFRGARRSATLAAAASQALREWSRSQGTTPFLALLAAFNALLHRYTAQDDLLLGIPIANRNRLEVEPLIGFFLNMVVQRTDLAGDPTLRQLLARASAWFLSSLPHQEVPFEKLVEALQPERDLSRAPIFQVQFSLQNTPPAALALPGLTLTLLEVHNRTTKFDFTVFLFDNPEGLTTTLEYNTDLYDGATIERLLGHWTTLLAAVPAAAERRLSELPLLTAGEREQLLAVWNRSDRVDRVDRAEPAALPVHRAFERQAALHPERVALVHEVDELTYGALNARANRLAHRLRALGVGPEVPVGLCVERSLATVVGLLGILKAGGAYMPLDPAYPEERLAFTLADALGDPETAVLVTEERVRERLAGAFSGRTVLISGEADGDPLAAESDEDPGVDVDPESLAYVIYTSGSTGRPKGVAVTHGNVARLMTATDAWFGFGPDDVWTLFHSYAFDFSVWELWGALCYGGRLVVVPRQVAMAAADFHELLVTEGVTVLNQTPSAFRQLVQVDEAAGGRLALRTVIFGGEALELAALAPWFAGHGDRVPRLVNMYGITETTVHVTYRPIDAADLDLPGAGPIGVPIPDLQLHLVGPRGELVPVGVSGEMWVGGAGVARGYLGRPDLTAERFTPDPFAARPGARLYRSGDLARRRPDGDLDYLGRIDHQVKIRGFRIELGEIETALARHPEVREVVVVARPDERGERRLVAYLVVEGRGPEAAALRVYLKESLPDYMVPAVFVPLDRLPQTPSGKVDRRALPEPRAEGAEAQTAAASAPPRSRTERRLAEAWREVLRIDSPQRVGVRDNFFDLGGHSLLVTQLVSRLRAAFGVELPMAAVFEAPTLEALAARLDLLLPEGAESVEELPAIPAIPAIDRGGDLPLSFAQERLWFLDQLAPASPLYNVPVALRLHGGLSVAALAATLGEIVRRHEVLRTGFASPDGPPLQRIAPPAALPLPLLPLIDLSALPAARREAEMLALAAAEARRGFDLKQPPLLRAGLLRLDADEHALLVTLHHIASDGWSMGVLVREVVALYGNLREGLPSPLPELPLQYADFAAWQRRHIAGDKLESELRYWREELAGAPTVVELPADHPRPPLVGVRGCHLRVAVAPEATAALQTLARQEGATLFMTLFAALALHLRRYSGQDELLIGSPVAGRNRQEIEGLIGFFVNTLVLRARMAGRPTFRALLARVRETTLAAYAHQDLPFEKLVDHLEIARDPSRSPLFQVLFVLQNAPHAALELPGLRLAALPVESGNAKFELSLALAEEEGGLGGYLELSTDLFEAATGERMLRHWAAVLGAVTADPERPIGDIPLLDGAERRELLSAWNRTTVDALAALQFPIAGLERLRPLASDGDGEAEMPASPDVAPIAGVEVHVLDLEGDPAPVGVCGELALGGVEPARGALEAPARIAERFVPDPFSARRGARLYRTGERVRRRADGSLESAGRPRLPASRAERAAAAAGEAGEAEGRGGISVRRAQLEGELARVWCEVLGVDRVGRDDNFFDVGGHSLLLATLHARLSRLPVAADRSLSVLDLFRNPTVRSQARLLAPEEGSPAVTSLLPAESITAAASLRPGPAPGDRSRDVAIVGMALRFPGAGDPEALWANLAAGVESVRRFSDEELLAAGVSAAEIADPAYVKAGAVLDGVELFDPRFFGLTPREAALMDPQHRLLLEIAWEALERAGYDPARYPHPIGVFAGAGMSTYLLRNLATNPEALAALGTFQAMLGNDKDFVPSRVAYKLDLKGPAVAVQTACSTSLVALHLAAQSLLDGDCRMALAGGVTVRVPQQAGYLFQEGAIHSPDGSCRAFDAASRGTVGGSGAGLVLLKRLADALADGDTIYAVVKGTAINNDGALKVGFTAPSVEGQAAVIAEALARAGVAPETIDYVEAHGTGTPLGDPIEVAALVQALGVRAGAPRALGSIKTNFGHLDAAAGVAGLIKAALALHHRQIPASLHFERANPEIDLVAGGLTVPTALGDWPAGDHPRRAGVSSFGIGGTNAHAVLEEAPAVRAAPLWPEIAGRPFAVLPLAARTPEALDAMTRNLGEHLRRHPELPLADVAYTLQVGRRAFEHRRVAVLPAAAGVAGAAEALATLDPARLVAGRTAGERRVAFLFPGQGTSYAGMGRELYAAEPVFRAEVDRCADLLHPHLGLDLRSVLYPDLADAAAVAAAAAQLETTALAQPALFVVELALARLWISWGIRPAALLGHSLGEYTAACLAGVLSIEAALPLVAARGRLMASLAEGAMLSVPLPEADLLRRVADLGLALDLAAVNGSTSCVASGTPQAIAALREALAGEEIEAQLLRTARAFHSALMEPVVGEIERLVAGLELAPPRIPYLSNVTGDWITAAEATDPAYWARHLRQPVRFAAGIEALCRELDPILLEVGPGRSLSGLARQVDPGRPTLPSLRRPKDGESEEALLLETLGRLWVEGAPVDWEGFQASEVGVEQAKEAEAEEEEEKDLGGEEARRRVGSGSRERTAEAGDPGGEEAGQGLGSGRLAAPAGAGESGGGEKAGRRIALRRRVPLPTYPFERQRCWIDARPLVPGVATGRQGAGLRRSSDPATWFLTPQWRRVAPAELPVAAAGAPAESWLVLSDGSSLAEEVVRNVVLAGRAPIEVLFEPTAVREGSVRDAAGRYQVDPADDGAWGLLLRELAALGTRPVGILHLGCSGAPDGDFERAQRLGLCSLLALARALDRSAEPVRIVAVASGLHEVTGGEELAPERATLLGPCLVIPQELPQISCRAVDVDRPAPGSRAEAKLARAVVADALGGSAEPFVAFRGGYRWVRDFAPLAAGERSAAALPLRTGGTYLITGGFGRVGRVAAEVLWRAAGARLVLLGRSPVPPRDLWSATPGFESLAALVAEGAEILALSADVADDGQLASAVAEARRRCGRIDGVLHAAGVVGTAALLSVQAADRTACAAQLRPKVAGLSALTRAFSGDEPDFYLLFSSIAAFLGGLGFAAYAAANAYLDAEAHRRNREGSAAWVSVDWEGWRFDESRDPRAAVAGSHVEELALSPEEGAEALRRLFTSIPAAAQIVVSTADPNARLSRWSELAAAGRRAAGEPQAAIAGGAGGAAQRRPEMRTAYAPPRDPLEETIAAAWRDLIGIDPIGIDDDFFELGGHSVLATQLAARLRRELRMEIPLERFFEQPTVAGLADLARGASPLEDARRLEEILAEIESLSAEEEPA